MLTNEAAEHMQSQGGFYTAAKLANETSISAKEATGLLYNIRQGKKYQTDETSLPGREVKVITINGNKQSKANLWHLAMFGAA
ncbi:hypothetical protein [Colwellia psychrerythraea]|uniref:Uncharacterized protein n=1 Tax=Colwellia psychrerythraea TaxID=28229 RepID=A0A099KGP5_COLPS|nr:hypothetical protein [Colwellia psychrerythraea]KGJ89516.1 hypothetical protein GAB14E_0709 [Colwellia psychrerythraea]